MLSNLDLAIHQQKYKYMQLPSLNMILNKH